MKQLKKYKYSLKEITPSIIGGAFSLAWLIFIIYSFTQGFLKGLASIGIAILTIILQLFLSVYIFNNNKTADEIIFLIGPIGGMMLPAISNKTKKEIRDGYNTYYKTELPENKLKEIIEFPKYSEIIKTTEIGNQGIEYLTSSYITEKLHSSWIWVEPKQKNIPKSPIEDITIDAGRVYHPVQNLSDDIYYQIANTNKKFSLAKLPKVYEANNWIREIGAIPQENRQLLPIYKDGNTLTVSRIENSEYLYGDFNKFSEDIAQLIGGKINIPKYGKNKEEIEEIKINIS